jgi:hypothetical protein
MRTNANNVTTLPIGKKVLHGVTPRRAKLNQHATRNQLMTASAIGAVAVTLTGLSLNHLASGIATMTHCPCWQSWAMAIGVDCAFVSLELAQLTISDKLRARLASCFRPAIIGTLAWSAGLNALAFAGESTSPIMQAAAIALGLSIPALVYALTKIGAAIYLDSNH